MKHKNEWITCDRCGNEIKENPKSLLDCICYAPRKWVELDTTTISGIDACVNKAIKETESGSGSKVLAMDISFTYRGQTTGLHLCPKCRKDFEKFMKGEL